ncbi:MAG: hypothetical protein CMJ58_25965 [Planctomycetaceae bacterium]|nr:hypothetical protein [Planctomycetaceae bacterium]
MSRRHFVFAIGAAWLTLLVSFHQPVAADEPAPPRFGHAHNDYRHERPLLDALDAGFVSVEADVFLRDGELLVGHDSWGLLTDRTLERLYLAPLAERVRRNKGRVHADTPRFWLFIDFKTDGAACYAVLREQLAEYTDILTRIEGDKVRPGAVTVVISGDRPIDAIRADRVRHVGVDGRLSDLDSDAPPHLMPVISDAWFSHFKWIGKGEMPADQRDKLRNIVAKAHERGRTVRFWATPESEPLWAELRAAGVDLLNTDQLARLAEFARRQR